MALAFRVVEQLVEAGMQECVVCAGARNVAFLNVLVNEPRIKKWWSYEERSSAYFALGRIRATRRPVAVVTTSGTAVGELLPAAMEAYYTSLPLMMLTADRPRRFREANAPQTCDQKGIFGVYAPSAFDVELQEQIDLSMWDGRSPLHVNVCFEEPAKEKVETGPLSFPMFRKSVWEPPLPELTPFLEKAERLLVIVSTLRPEARESVFQFVKGLGADVYAEGISGIRGKVPHIAPKLEDYTHVLRIGGVPVTRLWRDIEEKRGVDVLSLTEAPFAGISWGKFIHCNLEKLPQPPLKGAIAPSVPSEKGIFHDLSCRIPEESLIFLGPSLPVRDWDREATLEDRRFDIQASRGLNGMDGLISTFLGLSEKGRSNWAILGDLSTLYDLSGPWFLPQIAAKDITIAVINNRGGRIFEKMFPFFPEMLNAHQLSFEPVARLWGLAYEKWEKIPQDVAFKGARLVEIIT